MDAPSSSAVPLTPDLIERLRAMDQAPWQALLTAFEPRLAAFLRSKDVRGDANRDICQQTWTELVEDVEKLRPCADPWPLISTIAARRAADFHRRNKLHPATGHSDEIENAVSGARRPAPRRKPTKASSPAVGAAATPSGTKAPDGCRTLWIFPAERCAGVRELLGPSAAVRSWTEVNAGRSGCADFLEFDVIVAGPVHDERASVDGRERSSWTLTALQEFVERHGRVLIVLLPGPEFRVEDSSELGREYLPRWEQHWRSFAHGGTLWLLRSIGIQLHVEAKACREVISNATEGAASWARRHADAADQCLSVTADPSTSVTPISWYASGEPFALDVERGSATVVLPFRQNEITHGDLSTLQQIAAETLLAPRLLRFRVRFDRKNKFRNNVFYPMPRSGSPCDPGHLEPKLCAFLFAVLLEAWSSNHPRVSRHAVARHLREAGRMRPNEKLTTLRREANRCFGEILLKLGRQPHEIVCADQDLLWFRFAEQFELVDPAEMEAGGEIVRRKPHAPTAVF